MGGDARLLPLLAFHAALFNYLHLFTKHPMTRGPGSQLASLFCLISTFDRLFFRQLPTFSGFVLPAPDLITLEDECPLGAPGRW